MVCVRENVSDLPCEASVMVTDRGKGLSSVDNRKNDEQAEGLLYTPGSGESVIRPGGSDAILTGLRTLVGSRRRGTSLSPFPAIRLHRPHIIRLSSLEGLHVAETCGVRCFANRGEGFTPVKPLVHSSYSVLH